MIRRALERIKPKRQTLDGMAMEFLRNRYSRAHIQRLQADAVLQRDEWTFIGRFVIRGWE